MISIQLNGEKEQIEKAMTLQEVLLHFSYKENTFVVAVNETLIPSSHYSEKIIRADDHIEIITAMPGG